MRPTKIHQFEELVQDIEHRRETDRECPYYVAEGHPIRCHRYWCEEEFQDACRVAYVPNIDVRRITK